MSRNESQFSALRNVATTRNSNNWWETVWHLKNISARPAIFSAWPATDVISLYLNEIEHSRVQPRELCVESRQMRAQKSLP